MFNFQHHKNEVVELEAQKFRELHELHIESEANLYYLRQSFKKKNKKICGAPLNFGGTHLMKIFLLHWDNHTYMLHKYSYLYIINSYFMYLYLYNIFKLIWTIFKVFHVL